MRQYEIKEVHFYTNYEISVFQNGDLCCGWTVIKISSCNFRSVVINILLKPIPKETFQWFDGDLLKYLYKIIKNTVDHSIYVTSSGTRGLCWLNLRGSAELVENHCSMWLHYNLIVSVELGEPLYFCIFV